MDIEAGNVDDSQQALLLSINDYQKQLQDVNIALENADESNSEDLKELQLNLIQILELTLTQLDSIENENYVDHNSKLPQNENFDSELERFKQEISLLESPSKPENGNKKSENINISVLKELKSLEGKQVRVRYTEKWGGFSYHNAIIFKLITNDDGEPDLMSPKVSVLFNQPTNLSMLPCRFYFNEKCKFETKMCKFSHGEEVLVSDLQDYITPNNDFIKETSKVLVLHDKYDIWHQGLVQDVLQDRTAVSFDCSVCREVFDVNIHELVSVYAHETHKEQSDPVPSSHKFSISPSHNNYAENFSTNILTNNLNTSKLGDWEKYTKGIGSKLMAKMGYVFGQGLGAKGEGRIEPVPAYAYPQGVSLDRCMELRLKSNGENLYQVEKRLLKQQQINEDKQKKQQENLANRTSVFDIINNKLGGGQDPSTSHSNAKTGENTLLKSDSAKELNRKNLQLNSRITGLQKEVQKLKDSKKRQFNDRATVINLEKRIAQKEIELSSLQQKESKIKNEQHYRKRMKHFTSF